MNLVKRVFTPLPIVSYHSARKLNSYLVHAKLYPLGRKRERKGSYKCGNLRYLVCNNIEETDTFTNTITGKPFKINHHLCWNDKEKQLDLDYNETTIKKAIGILMGEEIKQKSLHELFLNDSHLSFEDVSLCLINKTDPSDPQFLFLFIHFLIIYFISSLKDTKIKYNI